MEIVYVSISQKIVKKNNQQSFKLSIHISSLFAFGILSVKIFNIHKKPIPDKSREES